MESKKMMGTFAILVIALSVVGFAYAMWSERVYIEGTVTMSELVVGWYNTSDYYWQWWETTNGVPEDWSGYGFVPKPWVANLTVEFSDAETSKHHDPPQTVYKKVTMTAKNVYPQWDVSINGLLKNAGTLPAIITDITLDFKDKTDNEVLAVKLEGYYYDGDGWYGWGKIEDPVVGNITEIEFYFEVPEDWELEPCNHYWVYIWVYFLQAAQECHTYTFDVTFEAIQWNKA